MKTLTTLACAAALALQFATATAQQDAESVPLPELTNEQLQAEYLECEREAGEGLLGVDMATQCSITYEAFKARVFDGDFERLQAWWRQRQVADTEPDAP